MYFIVVNDLKVLESLLVSSMLVLSSGATAFAESNNYVAKKIFSVLENEENAGLKDSTMGLKEAESRLKIEKQVDEWLNNLEFGNGAKNLLEFYGEKAFNAKKCELIDSILVTPDNYLDAEGNFFIGKKNENFVRNNNITKLYEYVFSAYVLNKERNSFNLRYFEYGFFSFLILSLISKKSRKG